MMWFCCLCEFWLYRWFLITYLDFKHQQNKYLWKISLRNWPGQLTRNRSKWKWTILDVCKRTDLPLIGLRIIDLVPCDLYLIVICENTLVYSISRQNKLVEYAICNPIALLSFHTPNKAFGLRTGVECNNEVTVQSGSSWWPICSRSNSLRMSTFSSD